jgi:hypothetical protein
MRAGDTHEQRNDHDTHRHGKICAELPEPTRGILSLKRHIVSRGGLKQTLNEPFSGYALREACGRLTCFLSKEVGA